jgi:hypothetical protein
MQDKNNNTDVKHQTDAVAAELLRYQEGKTSLRCLPPPASPRRITRSQLPPSAAVKACYLLAVICRPMSVSHNHPPPIRHQNATPTSSH